MITWAKDVDGALQYAGADEFRGIPHWEQHESACRGKGYFPLIGDAEPREGYTAEPATWHIEQREAHRIEPRQKVVPVYDEDPETHEQKKVGERTIMEDTEITLDKSYIQVDSFDYLPIPVPPPEPPPVVRYSKYKIQLACQTRGLWEQVKEAIADAGLADSWANIVDIASDNAELQAALPAIREAFGTDVVDEVLAESIAE